MRVTQYLLICVVIIAMLTGVVSAKTPTYGKPDLPLDGYPDEWNLASDFWGDMTGTSEISGQTSVYAKAYIRYDCDTNTVYLVVIDEPSPGPVLSVDVNPTVYVNNVAQSPVNVIWDYSSDYYAYGYEASLLLAPGSYNHFVIDSLFIDGSEWITAATIDTTLETTCGGVTPAPEFPSTFLPAAMIIGFLGAVLFIQRTREH